MADGGAQIEPNTNQPMTRKLAAEVIGTFFLVFAGTGAITINLVSGGVIGHAGIALTFGLVVLGMIQTFGDVSGAHFNPAVTLGFAAAGRFGWRGVPAYLAAQTVGACAASLLLRGLFSGAADVGRTLPAGPDWQSFALETVLTAMLMLTILRVADGSKEKGLLAGVAIGAVVGLEAMFAGPACGASMNPVRSLGPALAMGDFTALWIYLTAPVLGAVSAAIAESLVFAPPDPTGDERLPGRQ